MSPTHDIPVSHIYDTFNKIREIESDETIESICNQLILTDKDTSNTIFDRIVNFLYIPFLRSIHLSIITGEYINNKNEVVQYLAQIEEIVINRTAIEKFFKEIEEQLIKDKKLEIDKDNFRAGSWTDSFVTLFMPFIIKYRYLINAEYAKINDWRKTPLFDIRKITKSKNARWWNTEYDLSHFDITIQLALIDHNLTAGNDTFEQLLDIRQTLLDTSTFNNIGGVRISLLDKCNLLLKKFNLRFDNESKSYYDSDNKGNFFDIKDLCINIEHLKGFNYDLDLSFDREYFSGLEQHVRKKILKKKIDNYTYSDYLFLSKYYNKCIEDMSKLDNLIDRFKRIKRIKSKEKDRLFDEVAYDISLLFLENAKLSLYLRKKEYSLDDLWAHFECFNELQKEENKVKNYYPFLKLSLEYVNKIDEIIDSNDITIEDKEKNINRLGECIKELEHSYEWNKEHYSIVFQPPYNECVEKIPLAEEGYNKINLFVASAFIIPINYDAIATRIQEIKDKKREFDLNISAKKILKREFDAYKEMDERRAEIMQKKAISDANKKFEEELDKKFEEYKNDNISAIERVKDGLQRSNVEILSIFAVIALFALGNIQLYTKITSVSQAIVFSVGFALALSVFTLLIKLLISPPEKPEKPEKPKETEETNKKHGFWQKIYNWWRRPYNKMIVVLIVCCLTCIIILRFGFDYDSCEKLPQTKPDINIENNISHPVNIGNEENKNSNL